MARRRRGMEKLVRDILSRKTPDGRYVVIVRGIDPSRLRLRGDVEVEEQGDTVIIYTRSRRAAAEIARRYIDRLAY